MQSYQKTPDFVVEKTIPARLPAKSCDKVSKNISLWRDASSPVTVASTMTVQEDTRQLVSSNSPQINPGNIVPKNFNEPAITTEETKPAIAFDNEANPNQLSIFNQEQLATENKVKSLNNPSATSVPDPFDPSRFRLNPSTQIVCTTKVLTTVRVDKPGIADFVRTSTKSDHWLPVAILDLKDGEGTYLLTPEIHAALSTEPTVRVVTLVLYVGKNGVVGLWPLTIPNENARQNSWHVSAFQAATFAKDTWIRVRSNMDTKSYETIIAEFYDLPTWPKETMQQLLGIAFRNRVIDSLDHPILRRLRGQS